MESFEVGKAPWEVQSEPQATSFEVGKAPWEVSTSSQELPDGAEVTATATQQPEAKQQFASTVQPDYMNTPVSYNPIKDYNNIDPVVGKNDKWEEDLINKPYEASSPITAGIESMALTAGRAVTGLLEVPESMVSNVVKALGGGDITYYRDLNERLDKYQEEHNKSIAKSSGSSILKPSLVSEIALGFAQGNALKTITLLEGLTQAGLAEPGNKAMAGTVAAGTVVVGGKAGEAIINRYVGTDRTLRKLFKSIGMTDDQASTHYSNYSKLVGKDVKDFTPTDKVNAIVHGSPEAESILFESVATDPSNAKMLNEYYSKVSNKLVEVLNDTAYKESIALGKDIKKGIKEGYNNITKTLDDVGTPVQIDDNMKSAIDMFTKRVVSVLGEKEGTTFMTRVNNLMEDAGTVGDLFEVEKVVRNNLNKIDKLGTDASLTEVKATLQQNMQNLLIDTLKSNGLDNIVEARKVMNELYTKVSRANEKKLIKVLQDINVKKDDYKAIYNALKSTEEGSSYDNLISILGKDSRAAANVEEFVLDRLIHKNKDDLDVINLGKLIGNLDEVHFKSDRGQIINKIIEDFNKTFKNMKSTEAWAFETLDKGGSKSDFWNQIKASAVGRIASHVIQYLPEQTARRMYVINNLPKYLESGLVPKGITPAEAKGMEVYKTMLNNVDRFLAEEINKQAELSKAYEQQLAKAQPSNPLLPNNTTMTATERGSVTIGTGEYAAKSARANDVLGKPNTGQAVNSTTNEVQAPQREVVEGILEEGDNISKVNDPDIIDTEVSPSYMKGSDNRIFDMRGNEYNSVDDLIKAVESTKIPYKVNNKDLFKTYNKEFSKIVQDLLSTSNKSAEEVVKTIDRYIPNEVRIQNIMNNYNKEIQQAVATMDRANAYKTVQNIVNNETNTLIRNIEKDLGIKLPPNEANKIIAMKMKEIIDACK